MDEIEVLDELDQALVQALTVDGRVPFSRLAEVLEVSDQTVIRRYRRLRGEGLLRVVGLPLGEKLGLYESWLRVQCTPDAALAVADGLARRPDISWVTLNSGGTEIHCITRARSRQDRDNLLLQKLPGTRRVTGIAAHSVLRTFVGGLGRWGGLDVLTQAQVAALERPVDRSGPKIRLDEAESALLAELGRDGRTGYPELARATGLSESTVRRRVEQLRAEGAIYFDVEIDPRHFGYRTQAVLLATVPPSELAQAGAELGGHREVPFAAAITGSANLLAVVICRDDDALYEYLTTRVGALSTVRQLEVVPVLRTVKRAGMLMDGARLVDL
ncbi:Lrp/AsnC family transcriptional regulator [Kitasatospora sp. MMS16-BH015]|uniref:Lrp/AsnC family transcriptional regulator n=1 Tax=Kitasatospora sp. MMS16-BH015 TaxID=2018025 RepID=UPI0020C1C215|nr:Lrp/AsnC family transcriptional regulator [Kitasatospora sp. MMS16-BH015]